MDAQRPISQKLPAGLAGVLNPDENRDSAYFSSTDASSKHNSAASCVGNVLSPTGSGYQSSLADKTPSPVTANLVPQPLVSPASNMSVASMVSPTTPGSADPRRFERPTSLNSDPQLLAQDFGTASRRESVDSRINQGFHEMRLGGNSPYASHNQSTTSIQNTLNQQRNPRQGLDNLSVHRISNGYQPSNDRNPDPNPKIIRTAPAITGPATSNIARAAEPTKGQAWAFPEEEIQRIGPHDAYLDSRRSSVAESIASSQFTTESRLPPGQRRLDEPTDFNNRLSSTSSDFPPVHHHSLQHKQIGDLRDDDAASRTGAQPYSRTPELRKSHKLAERKRRTEMKELFDQLRDLMPQERGSKASKWEILTKAISEHQRMADVIRIVQGQNNTVMQENDALRQDNHNLRIDIQRLQGELHNLRMQQAPAGQAPPQAQVPPPPPQASYQADPYTNRRELPPIRGLNGAIPNGPDSMTGVQYEAPRVNGGYRPAEGSAFPIETTLHGKPKISISLVSRLPLSAHIAIDRLLYPTQPPEPLSFTMQSIRRAATRASLTSAISAAASAAPRTQSIAFALRSANAVRCFSVAAPRAFSRSIALCEEQQQFASEGARESIPPSNPPPSENCIFVQNYPFKVTREELAEAFSKFGEVSGVSMPPRKTFCFVYFKNAESIAEAVREVDGTFWHGRRIVVKQTDSRPQSRSQDASGRRSNRSTANFQEPTDTLYIGNLSFEATDAELNELFSVFQNVKDIRVAVDKVTGWPRGFAHAQFHSVEAAQEARSLIDGKVFREREIRVNFAVSKDNESTTPNNRTRRNEREADAAQAEEQKKHQVNDWDA